MGLSFASSSSKNQLRMKNTSPFYYHMQCLEFEVNVAESRLLSDILPQSYNLAFSSLKEKCKYHFCFLDNCLNEGLPSVS